MVPYWQNQEQSTQLPEQQSSKSGDTKENSREVTIWALLWGNNDFEVSTKSNNIPVWPGVDEIRFDNVKYKIYTLIIISAMIISYGMVVSAFQESSSKWNQGNEISKTIEKRIDDQRDYQETTEFIKKIEASKLAIISCFNIDKSCSELPEEIMKQKQAVKWYVQIGSLEREKMDIDEGKILKSINEFLLESSLSSIEERTYNGVVTNITIGEKNELENHIIQAPINLTITFNSQNNLVDFLTNLEDRIFYSQANGLNDSILYEVQQINYDIVNYDEAQDVEVILNVYAYDKK